MKLKGPPKFYKITYTQHNQYTAQATITGEPEDWLKKNRRKAKEITRVEETTAQAYRMANEKSKPWIARPRIDIEKAKAARLGADMSQHMAASVVYSNKNAWWGWENEGTNYTETSPAKRNMHPAIYYFFLLRTRQITVDQLPGQKLIDEFLSQ